MAKDVIMREMRAGTAVAGWFDEGHCPGPCNPRPVLPYNIDGIADRCFGFALAQRGEHLGVIGSTVLQFWCWCAVARVDWTRIPSAPDRAARLRPATQHNARLLRFVARRPEN